MTGRQTQWQTPRCTAASWDPTCFLVSVYTCGVLLIYINYMQQSRDWPHSVTDKLPASEPRHHSLLHTPSITVSTRHARWPLSTPGLAAAAIRARIHHPPPMTARLPAWLSASGLIIIFSLMMYLKQSEWMLSLWKQPFTSWQVKFVEERRTFQPGGNKLISFPIWILAEQLPSRDISWHWGYVHANIDKSNLCFSVPAVSAFHIHAGVKDL